MEVAHIVWGLNQRAWALPEFVIVRLEGYAGLALAVDLRYDGCVSIAAVDNLECHWR